MITVYMTVPKEEEAVKIVKRLLNQRLIACANMFPVRSMYWWDDDIQDDKEITIVAKAQEKNFEAIKDEVKLLHSYDVPCIVALPWLDSNEEYKTWVENETR